jgi:hypothetical protein
MASAIQRRTDRQLAGLRVVSRLLFARKQALMDLVPQQQAAKHTYC